MGSFVRSIQRARDRQPAKRGEVKQFTQTTLDRYAKQLAAREPFRIFVIVAISSFLVLAVVAVFLLSAAYPKVQRLEDRIEAVEARDGQAGHR
jgi:hypothetical protein